MMPTEIIEMILKFYHLQQSIIHITVNRMPLIKIVSLDQPKYTECKLQPLFPSKKLQAQHIETRTNICYVKDFKIPKDIFTVCNSKLNENKSYDAMFTIGTKDVYNRFGGAMVYIFEKYVPSIAYWWRIPGSLSQNECSFSVYSSKHGLIRVGREFKVLEWKTKQSGQFKKFGWKWKLINYDLKDRRISFRASMLTADKLFICGG